MTVTRTARIALIVACVLLVLAGLAAAGLYREAVRAGPHEVERVVHIERGAGPRAIARVLHEAGTIRDPRLFRLVARLTRKDRGLRAGEYAVPPRASLLETIEVLRTAPPVLHALTVPEGLTSAEIVALLAAEALLEGDVAKVPPEGSLLPETWSFVRGERREALLARMERAMEDRLAELWAARAPDLPLSSPHEALVLASIVEKETGIAAERPLIAGVFLNRLARGMRLQSDPTVIYGISGGSSLGRPLRQSELDRETPWNTYRIRGLPPTPIACPGGDALAAVLQPVETDFLYFVADGTGGHAFAATLEAHNRNVARWRRIERENGR